jgi:[ribosomal protein S5]-alanine N-acetyltransferase
MKMGIGIIYSLRLILREMSEEDTNDIVEWRSNPDVYKFFKSPHQITIQEHENWFNDVYKKQDNRYDLICIEKQTRRKIGVFGIIIDENKVEINYLLSPNAQHKGYATEAIKELIAFSKEFWNVNTVIAEIHRLNTRSIDIVKKLGFDTIFSNGDFFTFGRSVDK